MPSIRLSAVLLFSLVACTRNAGESSDAEQAMLSAEPGKDAGPAKDAGAAGPHITAVKALGSGCPNEVTSDVHVADDGASATIELRTYDVAVNRGDAFSIHDCSFAVQIKDSAGYAYSLDAFEAAGYASLRGTGVHAESSVKYYFQGNPVANETRQKAFASDTPAGGYTFAQPFGGETAVWSPCGGGRDLNVQSRLVLRNNADKTVVGYVSTETVKLAVRFKRCS